MKKLITLRFTQEELKQIDAAINNCWGDGDWLEWLDIGSNSKKEEKAFCDGWAKIRKAYKDTIN